MTRLPILTGAAFLLAAAGTINATGISVSSENMDSSCPPPDSPYEKIKVLTTKYEETGSQTEELEFDWIIVHPAQASSLPESGRITAKKTSRENRARTPSINWLMKLFPATSTSRLKDLTEQFLSEMNPDGHRVAVMTKDVQVGSTAEELEFDWVVQPFIDPAQASSDSGSGKVPEKGMAKENDD